MVFAETARQRKQYLTPPAREFRILDNYFILILWLHAPHLTFRVYFIIIKFPIIGCFFPTYCIVIINKRPFSTLIRFLIFITHSPVTNCFVSFDIFCLNEKFRETNPISSVDFNKYWFLLIESLLKLKNSNIVMIRELLIWLIF